MTNDCPYDMPFRHDAIKTSYIMLSAFSGTLSMIASLFIIYILSQGGWTKLSKPRNRLLLGLCIVDVLSSIAFGISIIPTPQETDCSIGMGNLSTCTAQGFFIQLSFAAPSYNAMMSLYYLLTIRYGISQATVSEKYELFMHAFAIIPSLTMAVIGLVNEMYFSEATFCWIGDMCQSAGNCPKGNIFGKGYGIVIASICFVSLSMVTTVVCMLLISRTLRQRNLAMKQYCFQQDIDALTTDRRLNNMEFTANESAKQAYLYAAAFIMTYIWPFCVFSIANITGEVLATPVWFHYHLAGVFVPLQGFWNFFAYVRPIISKTRRDNNDDTITFISALKILIGAKKEKNTVEDEDNNTKDNVVAAKADRRISLFSLTIPQDISPRVNFLHLSKDTKQNSGTLTP